jgi:adenine phosphoribosyltransferase
MNRNNTAKAAQGASDQPDLAQLLERLVRDVPDFPAPGVLFKDISPVLADHDVFDAVIAELAASGRDATGSAVVDKVVGIEARGFILAAPVALTLGAGFVAVRKKGKLPAATHEVTYNLEYGQATLEMHRDAFEPGDRVLVVDDVLATGGTVAATLELIGRAGAQVTSVAVLIELGFLQGRSKVPTADVRAILST